MLRRLPRKARQLRRDRRGTAAVEFAVILPVLLAIWAGMTELAHALDEWRKLTVLARTVADLTAQGDTKNPISTPLMTDIFASATTVMRPFNTADAKIVVSAMGVGLSGSTLIPTVCSSYATGNATPRSTGLATGLTVPPGYQTLGMRYVLAEVSIPYAPMIGSALVKLAKGVSGTITFSSVVPWPTRGGKTYGNNIYTEVVLPGANAAACDKSAP
ncbi:MULTISPECIES: TadE/TadG family type IV pilus assembly protein [unclassified Methylobacterium]|uniref:TadE/TadG family type IV pilus assembly protein n=1 Tax=unclassified Methylobacterium TaxID=2615210 RepID=UPI001FB915BC|nr:MULTISPECIES: TadE/TadG family type IV pilus assembly protein [unclassified Methylobacterium]MCJ2021423.1 pilus assembly protein [Methylobacterium sp. E-065]